MCFCDPTNRIPNCGSAQCQRLAIAADVLGETTASDARPQPIPTDDRLEIPQFLRRGPTVEAVEEDPDDMLDDGRPTERDQEEEPEPSAALPEEETPLEARPLPTMASIEETIKKLRVKRREIDETIRLLKAQGKKMWDRL